MYVMADSAKFLPEFAREAIIYIMQTNCWRRVVMFQLKECAARNDKLSDEEEEQEVPNAAILHKARACMAQVAEFVQVTSEARPRQDWY